ncbi:uncharacterized protein LOC110942838 [Helianthus annuus]|uniref:uncharacterized protein LOC110942838 n=1 Tax=Helianthus annuus TaxID=4232 RepID=UPI000B8FEB35|nr:uncharacterized protein LOC110942838 [Helianthus annuus]
MAEIVEEPEPEISEVMTEERFFSELTTGFCPQYEVEKTLVQEIIDVSKEMNEETLKEIADKALMVKLQEMQLKSQCLEKESESDGKSENVKTESDGKSENVKSESDGKSENVKSEYGEKSESESGEIGKTGSKNDKQENVFEKIDQILEKPCENCLKPCMDCLEKDKQFQELKKFHDKLKFDFNDVKESYDTLSRSIKAIHNESIENDKIVNLLKATVMDKQISINIHLDKIASLKKELELMRIETERVDKKLISYLSSSYKYPDGVEEALNLKLRTEENELPENIDVAFSPFDTDNESQLVKTSVDQVLDEESGNTYFETVKTHFENSSSDSEDDGNFLDKFIPKSDKVLDDDSIIVVYTMTGTDKLYTDFEYPIQNANLENVEKVFKLVEIDISEVNNNSFLSKPKKSFVNNPGKKNERVGNIANKRHEVEKDYIFSKQAVNDFIAAKKIRDEANRSTFVEYDKRICYRYNEIGHMAKKCVKKMIKPIFHKPNPKISKDVKGKSPMGLPRSIISKWIMDSGASRHMTGMLALLYDVKSINGGYVEFAGTQGGRIFGEGILTNGVVSFDKVNYIAELENNLLSISQICDKSFTVHFTKDECLMV